MDDLDVGSAIARGAADAVVVTDRAGVITHWNPGAERVFGFAAAEALGETLDLIIPEKLRKAHWAGYWQFVESGTGKYDVGHLLKVPALTKSGTTISVEFTLVAVTDAEGAVTHAVAVMRDVTAGFDELRLLRRRVRELESRSENAQI